LLRVLWKLVWYKSFVVSLIHTRIIVLQKETPYLFIFVQNFDELLILFLRLLWFIILFHKVINSWYVKIISALLLSLLVSYPMLLFLVYLQEHIILTRHFLLSLALLFHDH
jgi:hypothetical protein